MKRTIEGVTLESQGTDDRQWHGEVAGEAWVFFLRDDPQGLGVRRLWQGFTKDHLTGTPTLPTLGDAVLWVKGHKAEIEAKLLVRRAKGTRLVDPT